MLSPCVQDSSSPRGSPKCIVLCPTRELAKQVEKEFQASGPSLKVACLYGGTANHLLTSQSITFEGLRVQQRSSPLPFNIKLMPLVISANASNLTHVLQVDYSEACVAIEDDHGGEKLV